ncbi:hypothetical protein [Halalkalibacter urbisdiaboli]|nr:hypothetical protein [Halalkalibacter urbisdiaboli]
MAVENLYQELVSECTSKLGRELTGKEVELIQWVQEKQYESLFQQMKSS